MGGQKLAGARLFWNDNDISTHRPDTDDRLPRTGMGRPEGETDVDNTELCALMEAVAERQDKEAFAALFQRLAPRLKAYALRGGCSETEAEELVQETMLTVWRRAGSFNARMARVSTWVFTIVRNKRIDLKRRRTHPVAEIEEAIELPAETVDPVETLDAASASEAIREALKALPQEQLIVLQKAYFEDKSYPALAEELGIPLGTVKSRIRLGLQRLRVPLETFA